MADAHTGGMIALIPSDPSLFVVPGGDPVAEMHLTLAYLGDDVSVFSTDQLAALDAGLAEMATTMPPIQASVMGHAAFNPDDPRFDPCAVYLLNGELDYPRSRAESIGRDVLGADMAEQHANFLPHITAGYGIDVATLTYTGPVIFDTLRLALGDTVTDYPLTGTAPTATDDTAPLTAAAPKTPGVPVELVIAIEAFDTSDGRYIEADALQHLALPLPLLAQTQTPVGGGGHDGAEVVGRIDALTRVYGPDRISLQTRQPFPEGTYVWLATGEMHPDSWATDLVERGYLTGNSVDLTMVDAELVYEDGDPDSGEIMSDVKQARLTAGWIAGTTLVPFPAFPDAYVALAGRDPVAAAADLVASAAPAWRSADIGDDVCAPCLGIGDDDIFTLKEEPVTASAAPMFPPAWMFADPALDGPTPLTLESDANPGWVEVYGHLGTWGTCHTSFADQCVTVPRSASNYAYFAVGAVRAQDADAVTEVPVGHITMGEGGHAALGLNAADAAAHYDNINTVVADIAAGEDAHGVWVHGVVRRTATPEQIDALRAAPLSGDWRLINGRLEMVAALAVNRPGFPIPRVRVASGAPEALVAAGVVPPGPAPKAAEVTISDADADKIAAKIAALLVDDTQVPDDAVPPPGLADRHAAAASVLTAGALDDRRKAALSAIEAG